MRPASTLAVLVTCSREESRRDLALAVARNLARVIPDAGLEQSFVLFDNASTCPEHIELMPPGTLVCRADRNVGYWSAIKWVLDHRTSLFDREFEYIYLIESDLYHADLKGLVACERFLSAEPRASSVRTQEFSVRGRWRYDKRLQMLPFHVLRSEISLSNVITGERAWFQRARGHEPIYLSNLHPKLPALNRVESMQSVFDALEAADQFTESDFFRLMMQRHPLTGVYDGGMFHSLVSYSDRGNAVMSSYVNLRELTRFGYEATRKACIDLDGVSVDVSRSQ